jgi:hypothetical protein
MNHAFRSYPALTINGATVYSDDQVIGEFSSPDAAKQVVNLLRSPNWTPTQHFKLTTDDWNKCRSAGTFSDSGYFVDWNGRVHDLQALGPSFGHDVVVDTYHMIVSVIDHEGGEIFRGDYHPDVESLRACGVAQ